MKKIATFLVILSVFILSGCEENIDIDITTDEELIYYIGSNIEDVTKKVSITGIDDLENVELVVDTSFVNIYKPGEYNIVFTILRGESVVFKKTLSLEISSIPLTDYPEINYAKDIIYVIGNDEPDYFETVTATDRTYGDLTTSIAVNSSQVDYQTEGIYTVNYLVQNNDGLHNYTNITVYVVDNVIYPDLPEQFFIVQKDGMYGVVDLNEDTIIDFEFEKITYLQDSVFKLQKHGVHYYYNFDEQVYFTLPVEINTTYRNGLARVQNLIDEYGYVNTLGEKVITCEYDVVRQLTSTHILISNDDKYGVIDVDGNPVIEMTYDDIYHLEGNLFVTVLGSLSNIITLDGEILFSGAKVLNQQMHINNESFYIVKDNDVLGIMNEQQDIILDPQYKEIYTENNLIIGVNENNTYDLYNPENNILHKDIYTYQTHNDYYIVSAENGFGLITNSLETVVTPSMISIEGFTDTLFIVKDNSFLYGIIDTEGSIVLPFEYVSVSPQDNETVVVVDSFEHHHLVNSNGIVVSSFNYVNIQDFVNGYAIVEDSLGYYGMINELGQEVLTRSYTGLTNFYDGYAKTYNSLEHNDAAWGVIDTNFNTIIENEYYFIGELNEGVFVVRKTKDSNSSGYITKTGSILLPAIFNETYPFTEGFGRVKLSDGSYKIINNEGVFITEQSFFYIKDFKDGYSEVTRTATSSSNCLIDTQGNLVTSCIYESVEPYYEGFAVIKTEDGFNYINNSGEKLLSEEVTYAGRFNNGIGIVIKDGSYHTVDSNGTFILEGKKDITFSETSPLLLVHEETDLYGYYEVDGTHLITSKYSMANNFMGSFAFTCIDPNHCGVLNHFGEEVLPLEYKLLSITEEQYILEHNGISYIVTIHEDHITKERSQFDKYMFMYDQSWHVVSNNMVYNHDVDDLLVLSNNYVYTVVNGLYGTSMIDGEVITEASYDDIIVRTKSSMIVVKNGYYGLVYNTDEVLSPSYTKIEPLYGDLYMVHASGLLGVYDQEGHELLGIFYQEITHHHK